MEMASRKSLKLALVSSLTILFLALILWQSNKLLLKSNLYRLLSFPIALAFIFYILSYLLRALRWQLMLEGSIPLPQLFHIVILHTVANNIMPFRSGELSFLYFCKKLKNIPLKVSTTVLVGARVADLLSLGILFLLSLALLKVSLTRILIAVLILVILILVAFLLPHILKLANPALKKISPKLASQAEEAQHLYLELWKGKKLLFLLSTTLLIWVVKFFSFYIIVRHFLPAHYGINYWQVVLGSTASELSAALPLQTFAELGMFEAGWTGAFVLMGMNRADSVTIGFLLHMVMLIFSLILGVPAYLLFAYKHIKGVKDEKVLHP